MTDDTLAPAADPKDLEREVRVLATADGRVVGTPAHDAARRHLAGRLAQLDLEPYAGASFELPYAAGPTTLTNLVGVLPGADPTLAPLLLAAHYDTAGRQPGADDNAAAIAAVLAAVGPLRDLGLRRGVLVALFDAEEPPHFQTATMGSTRFYRHQRVGPVAAALVLDLVGHAVPLPGLAELLFVTGAETSPELAALVRETPEPPGLRVVPIRNDHVGDMSDHHVFRLEGRPFLFLSCGRWEHYHQVTDTPDRLDYAKLAAVSRYLVRLVAGLDGASLAAAEPTDTTALELERIRRYMLPAARAAFGGSLSMDTRDDIARLVSLATGLGL